jgi:excisionase family DNA binding protein
MPTDSLLAHGLTVNEAARRLDLSPQMVRYLANRNELPHTRTPYGRLFAPADVDRLREARQAQRKGGEA